MNDFVVTPPFWRFALWVAMETMHLHIAGTSFFLEDKLFLHSAVPKNRLAPMKHCPGCKVGQIRCWGILYSI